MPPKNKSNGYMKFIIECKNKDRQQGRVVREDSYYGAEWAKLPPEQKQRHKAQANGRSELQLTSGHTAHAPAGAISGDYVPDDDIEKQVEPDSDVRQMVEAFLGPDQESVAKRVSLIVATNVMVKTIEKRYYPMEIALAKYSLAEGVLSHYHQFTDPGECPLGYMNKATQHIDKTHKIPMGSFELAIGRQRKEREFRSMLDEISIFMSGCQFLYKGKTCVLMFTRDDLVDQVKGSLLSYIQTAGDEGWCKMWDEGRLHVVDIRFLIYRMYEAVNVPMTLLMCAEITYMASYDYMPGSCQWHSDQDNNWCALGVCKRCCYLISDSLLAEYEIEVIEGQHLPVSIRSHIHVEEGACGGAWSVSTQNERRPFINGSASGGNSRSLLAPAAAASEATAFRDESRNREFEPSADFGTDPRTRGGVGRGMRRAN